MIAIPHLWMVMVPITTPQICHPLPLLNSPSLMCAKAVLLPHHMAETWDIEALIQTVVPHHRIKGAAGQAMPSCNVWVPPHLLVVATYIMVATIPTPVLAYITVRLLLVDTVMVVDLILITQGAAMKHMQVVKAKAAMVTPAIATAQEPQLLQLPQAQVKLR